MGLTANLSQAETKLSDTDIRELSAARASNISRREFDAMVSGFYAEDAVLLPSGAATIRGIDSIREFWHSAPDHGLVSLTIETQIVEVSGDIGFEVGRFNRTLRPRHGAPFQESGKFLVIYRQQGEAVWRAVAEMFNTDSR